MTKPTPIELVERLRGQHTALAGWLSTVEQAREVELTSHQIQITMLARLLDECRRTLAELEARLAP
jgi:hypothetical protein